MSKKILLQWNDFKENITSAFGILREDGDFSDVTLVCEDGKQFEAHRVTLATSSPFFQNILRRNKHSHPLIYMRGMKSDDLLAILDFIYCGEANVYQESLNSFLAIAEELQLKGLMGTANNDEVDQKEILKKKNFRVSKTESFLSKFSEPFRTFASNQVVEAENDTASDEGSAQAIDLQELNNKLNSMMEKTSRKSACGNILYKCTLCGKEERISNLSKHIEANHLEGFSIPCKQCKKTFRSRNSLTTHKHLYHKQTSRPPQTNVFQDKRCFETTYEQRSPIKYFK